MLGAVPAAKVVFLALPAAAASTAVAGPWR
ncbi:unannotated protein [freshwater metagenome]|uniref:Unannotated protein n=1 Tax=freshwater metagenome TaxID=449393 RepID=A0A6J7J5D4_9ZZZZ